MIVVDNCIISSLAKVGRLHLLRNFKKVVTSEGVVKEAYRSGMPAIIDELRKAQEGWLGAVASREPQDIPYMVESHPQLSPVDCELILICLENRAVLLSDDSHHLHIAEREFKLETYDLFDALMTLKEKGILKATDTREVVGSLERMDRYRFSQQELLQLLK